MEPGAFVRACAGVGLRMLAGAPRPPPPPLPSNSLQGAVAIGRDWAEL
jgi:hypothetical protein